MDSGALWVPKGKSRAPVFLLKPFIFVYGSEKSLLWPETVLYRFRYPFGSILAPFWNQNRETQAPKRPAKPHWFLLRFVFHYFCWRFWYHFGTISSRRWPPFSHQNRSPGPVWSSWAPSWPSCTEFGSHFGRFGPLFGDSGFRVGAIWGVLWEIWSLHFRHELGTQGGTNDELRTNHKHHNKHQRTIWGLHFGSFFDKWEDHLVHKHGETNHAIWKPDPEHRLGDRRQKKANNSDWSLVIRY